MKTIKTKQFEGPLDLLLNLIEKEKLDICRISLAKITNEYLVEIQKIDETSENMADFLIVASKLLYLKSKAVLPVLANEEEEGEIRDLEEQLREYKKYKEASKKFENILNKNMRSFESNVLIQNHDLFLPPENVDMRTLMNILQDVMSRVEKDETVERTVETKITLEEKLSHLQKLMSKNKKFSFHTILKSAKTKGEVVVTFLALLELIKRKMATVSQKKNFGDLVVTGI